MIPGSLFPLIDVPNKFKFDGSSWVTIFGNSTVTEGMRGFCVDAFGNSYISGNSRKNSSGDIQLMTVKVNISGDIVWQCFIGSLTVSETGFGVAVDEYGNVYSGAASGSNIVVCKISPNGSLLWSKLISRGDLQGISLHGLTIDKDKNIILTGWYNGTYNELLLISIDTHGTIKWQKRYYTSANNRGLRVTTDNLNNIYVGYYGGNYYYPSIIKVDEFGTILWQQKFSIGTSYGYPGAIVCDEDGYVYYASHSQGNPSSSFCINLTKFDSDGNRMWYKTYGNGLTTTTSYTYGFGLSLSPSGDIYLSGSTSGGTPSLSNGSRDAIILRLDMNGNIVWARALGGVQLDESYGIGYHKSDSIMIGGITGSETSSVDFFVARFPIDGSRTKRVNNMDYRNVDLAVIERTVPLVNDVLIESTFTIVTESVDSTFESFIQPSSKLTY